MKRMHDEYLLWILSHLEAILFIAGSTILFVYFDRYNKRRTKFLCILNGMIGMIIICLAYFVCVKANINWWKYVIAGTSPYWLRPFISKLLTKSGPMWDNIFELVDKKITKYYFLFSTFCTDDLPDLYVVVASFKSCII